MDSSLSGRVQIPVSLIEFDVGGNTLWIQSPDGATVLRIKARRGIEIEKCEISPVSHADIYIEGSLSLCVSKDAITEAVRKTESDE